MNDIDHGAPRYAIYWAPANDHPLWRAGCEWLGRDPESEPASAVSRRHAASPARYGFHATLKPPMRLRPGASLQQLEAAVASVAAGLHAFEMPSLHVVWAGDFLALTPCINVAPEHPLRRLADACVSALDEWRRLPSPAESARRQATSALNPRQAALVSRWGYPHVFDEWRFHMTLSDKLDRNSSDAVLLEREAREWFASALAEPLRCDSVCIYTEPHAGVPLRLTHRFALSA